MEPEDKPKPDPRMIADCIFLYAVNLPILYPYPPSIWN